MEAEDQKKRSKRPVVFLAVGVVNTLLDFGFYTLLSQTILKDSISIAGLVSGTISLFIAFLTHSLITWKGTEVSPATLGRFFIFTGFGMWIIRPILLSIFILFNPLYAWMHSVSTTLGLPLSYDFIAKTGAYGFMIIIVLIYNYLTYDRFVFHKKKQVAD